MFEEIKDKQEKFDYQYWQAILDNLKHKSYALFQANDEALNSMRQLGKTIAKTATLAYAEERRSNSIENKKTPGTSEDWQRYV